MEKIKISQQEFDENYEVDKAIMPIQQEVQEEAQQEKVKEETVLTEEEELQDIEFHKDYATDDSEEDK